MDNPKFYENKLYQDQRNAPWSSLKTQCSRIGYLAISQSKFIFQVITEKLQCNKCSCTWKATRKALRSLKLVAWNKTIQTQIHQKRKETEVEEKKKVTSTCAISEQIQVHIINNNDKSSIHTPWFCYYIGSQFNISFNLFRQDWDAKLLERLLGRRFHSWVPLYLNIRCPNLVLIWVK